MKRSITHDDLTVLVTKASTLRKLARSARASLARLARLGRFVASGRPHATHWCPLVELNTDVVNLQGRFTDWVNLKR
jgi:hypothetical protein